jgi:predicted metallo-beta-lactamase superfamily hydrolase
MKIYLVERLTHVYYDEYDSFVIRAKDKETALEIANQEEYAMRKSEIKITELLPEGDEGVILGSYNAS